MSDLRGFARVMALMGERIETNTSALVRRVAVQVDGAVVLATPVDTGRARLNWQVEINGTPSGTLPEPPSPGAGASDSIAKANAAIAGYRTGDVINIVNNLPYIQRLNEGWSAQAPAAFVEKAIHVGVQTIKDATIVVSSSGSTRIYNDGLRG